MKKYKANIGYTPRVEIVECERETASCVWINGRKSNKRSSYENFFDTFEEAKQCCIDDCEKTVASARHRLEGATGRLGNAKGLKDPTNPKD
jgi:hypothetical protein